MQELLQPGTWEQQKAAQPAGAFSIAGQMNLQGTGKLKPKPRKGRPAPNQPSPLSSLLGPSHGHPDPNAAPCTHLVHMGPCFYFAEVPLDGIPSFCCMDCTTQLSVISKLAEGAQSITSVTDEDAEERRSYNRPLGDTATHRRPPPGHGAIQHNPLNSLSTTKSTLKPTSPEI